LLFVLAFPWTGFGLPPASIDDAIAWGVLQDPRFWEGRHQLVSTGSGVAMTDDIGEYRILSGTALDSRARPFDRAGLREETRGDGFARSSQPS
jgi:hypothetical protein